MPLNEEIFQEKLSYASAQNKNDKNCNKQRKRNIIYYNPIYSGSPNINTNIGKTCLKVISKHFPKTNKLSKIFNKNNKKISYSCMSNISSVISGHNKNFLDLTVTQYGLNCRIRENCPLQNQFLTPGNIHGVDVHCKPKKRLQAFLKKDSGIKKGFQS